jgi:hypothetical protein
MQHAVFLHNLPMLRSKMVNSIFRLSWLLMNSKSVLWNKVWQHPRLSVAAVPFRKFPGVYAVARRVTTPSGFLVD